jgi:hypothetical protein
MCEYIGHETNPCGCLELQKAKAEFAKAMGSLIVAEAVAKDEAEKRDKALADWARADAQHAQRLANAKSKIDEAKDWLLEARAGWSGSDNEFAEYYGELAEILGVEFTEEIDVELTFKMTARIKLPIGYDLDTSDFWVKNSATIDTQTDEVELLSSEDLYVDDVEVNS